MKSDPESIFYRILEKLVLAQDKRPQLFQLVVCTEKYSELGWILYERLILFDAVNRERVRLGKPTVTLVDIQKQEAKAEGDDYTRDLAKGCLELVLS